MAHAVTRPADNDGVRLEKFDLELLLYFTAVAEERSFTRAARRLEIDQSWLSRKIRQFEDDLGRRLIERTTRKLELTETGEAMLAVGRRMTLAADAARAEVSQILCAATERLRIGALPYSFTDPARNELIHGFSGGRPDVAIEVSNNASWVNANWVRSGRLDVAFASSPFDVTGLEVLVTMPNVYKIMVPGDDPLSRLDEIRLADLAGRRLVTPPPHRNPYTYAAIYEPFVEAGVIAVPAPEFERFAMRRFAISQRLFKLMNVTVNEDVIEGYVARPLADHPQRSHKCLIRRKGDTGAVTADFWRVAAAKGGHLLTGVAEDGTWLLGEVLLH
jgi:DNA-binding transcriptional LysR family regulator